MSTQGKTEIEVKMEHIVRGEAANQTRCPVALAIRESTGVGTVYVKTRRIYWANKKGCPRYECTGINVPAKVSRFIRVFDDVCSLRAQPFKFSLPIPKRKKVAKR